MIGTDLWFSEHLDDALFRVCGDGQVVGLDADPVSGYLTIATPDSVAFERPNGWACVSRGDGIIDAEIQALAVSLGTHCTSQGENCQDLSVIWVGTNEGLSRYDEVNGWTRFIAPISLPYGNVNDLEVGQLGVCAFDNGERVCFTHDGEPIDEIELPQPTIEPNEYLTRERPERPELSTTGPDQITLRDNETKVHGTTTL